MNIKFTVEESNLISIFESESREAVIQNILDTKKYVDDMEMLEVMSRVLEKLNSISDEKFEVMEFVAAE
ncbi:transposon-transfer assisting family protein [Blautia sp.]|uniref:transposon-transfer assisting family protein n=1 Tax=Blautia sp. TaxID=1955243 RepID=UPI003AB52BD2